MTSATAVAQSCSGSDFIVQYSSFIPVDHINGPSACKYRPDVLNPIPIICRGDAFRSTYRTTESIRVTPATQQEAGFSPNDGLTQNYAAAPVGQSCPKASPINGSIISDASPPIGDFDGIPQDCCLWNENGQSQDHFGYGKDVVFSTSQSGTKAFVHFFGSGSDPLEPTLLGIVAIRWDVTITVDSSTNTASVAYDHTCYPAHVVKVNGKAIYDSQRDRNVPTSNDIVHITQCLMGLSPHIQGSTTPQSVLTY